MFKKLRVNMIRFNMLTISIVVILAFAAIYLTTYLNIQQENARKSEFSQNMLFPYGNAPGRNRPMNGMQPPETAEERYSLILAEIADSKKMLTNLLVSLTAIALAVLLALAIVCRRFADLALGPIEESYYKQRQFIADASHELRTPLAVISANIDAISSSGDETVDSQKEWFGYIRLELKRVGQLVDDLLYLAKSDAVKSGNSLPFDLSEACEAVCASMEAVLYDAGKTLTTDIETGVVIASDKGEIAKVLYILLDNAGKYTPKNGEITLKLSKEADKAILKVINTGEGITKEALPKIFDRFYRADLSRSSEKGGYGLGLSIAKSIVENAGGAISAESSNGLTAFEVKLRHVRKAA